MKHFIIGTAGHIDHGKTTLIKALTGYDADRLAEEKKRGITIELGFTSFCLPDGQQVGIVDVPGHEKFISNMVPGVAGMDMVLLVIAADEGIMPQTIEHMDILKLLGIKRSIVVLNKIDLVDEEWLEMIEEEIKSQLKGTGFAEASLVKVSAVTGQGIQELIREIERMAKEEIETRDICTIPRLPIDRVFTLAGFGTIVTGTLLSGKIEKEDRLTIYPLGQECRVRNIQVHGENTKVCYAGQRAALNLSNINKEEIYRGCVLAPRGSMNSTNLLDAKLHILEHSKRTLKNNSRLHLLIGTDEVLCRTVLLDKEELKPGESGYVQFKLEKEIAVQREDRFIVRFYSPLETIGGGIILDANPKKKKRFQEEVIQELKRKEKGSTEEILELQLEKYKKNMITVADLAQFTARSVEEVQKDIEELQKKKKVFVISTRKDTYVWHMNAYHLAEEMICARLKEYEEKYPYRYGMKKSEIQASCLPEMKQNVFDQLIEHLEMENIIKRKNEILCTAEHKIKKDRKFVEISEKYIEVFMKKEYNFTRVSDIEQIEQFDISDEIVEDILHALEEEEIIVKISEDIYTVKCYMDEAILKIQEHFTDNPIITIVQVKEMFDTSRKNAKLLIEYMDKMKVTKKSGGEAERTAY